MPAAHDLRLLLESRHADATPGPRRAGAARVGTPLGEATVPPIAWHGRALSLELTPPPPATAFLESQR